MLFGTQRVRDLIYSDLKKIEEENNVVVILGATVDGVAMGVTKYSSDLDLRFCFLYKDATVLSCSELHDESKIRIQVKYEQNAYRPYNAITLWEAHAFFHFIVDPQINQGQKYKLASIVYDTFCSPYLYDPIGLHAMIEPYFYRAYPVENEARYLCSQLKAFCEKELFTLADTMKYLNRYMKLRWIREYKTLPPLSSYSLLPVQSEMIKGIYESYLEKLNAWSRIQQQNDDWTKDLQIERPDEVCNLIVEAIKDERSEIDYTLFNKNNKEVECIFCILQDIRRIAPPQHGGFFWGTEDELLFHKELVQEI